MTTLLLVTATALMLGALHAFDADHLAAVTAFIVRRPTVRAALTFAIHWGLGHAATLLLVGVISTLFSLALTPDIETAAELAVGTMLIGIGVWVLAGLARGRLLLEPHRHEGQAHTHLHRPEHSRSTSDVSGHSAFWVGALHGLAGSAGLLVIIPVTMLTSTWAVIAYIAAFSLGVTTAMAGYALAIGGIFGRVSRGAGARWYPWLAGVAGCGTLLLGLTWVSLTVSTL